VTPYILVDVNVLVEPAASVVMVEESNCGYKGAVFIQNLLGQDGTYFTGQKLLIQLRLEDLILKTKETVSHQNRST